MVILGRWWHTWRIWWEHNGFGWGFQMVLWHGVFICQRNLLLQGVHYSSQRRALSNTIMIFYNDPWTFLTCDTIFQLCVLLLWSHERGGLCVHLVMRCAARPPLWYGRSTLHVVFIFYLCTFLKNQEVHKKMCLHYFALALQIPTIILFLSNTHLIRWSNGCQRKFALLNTNTANWFWLSFNIGGQCFFWSYSPPRRCCSND